MAGDDAAPADPEAHARDGRSGPVPIDALAEGRLEALPLQEALWEMEFPDTVRYTANVLDMLGIRPEDAPRTRAEWNARVHPEDLAMALATTEAAAASADGNLHVEVRLRGDDGGYRWLRATGRPRPPGGAPGFVGSVVDITDERRMQDVFERLVKHNAAILDAAGEGICLLDGAGAVTFANPAAARILGCSTSELATAPLCTLIGICLGGAAGSPHDRRCPIALTLGHGEPERRYDLDIRRPSGGPAALNIVVTRVASNDLAGGAVAVFSDVTDRREAEERVQRERMFSNNLVASAMDGIVAVDTRLCVTVWNAAMARLTGVHGGHAMGKTLATVLPFLVENGDLNRLRGALSGRVAASVDQSFTVVGTDDTRWYEARFTPVMDEARNIVGALGTLRDTTENKAREQDVATARDRLVQSEKLAALGTLVSGVGHELRTPMAYINNHLYLLSMLADRIDAERPELKEMANEIRKRTRASMKGVQRMATLLDDLRAMYRPSPGVQDGMELKEVIAEALRLFAGAYEGPITVDSDLQETGPMIVETGRVQQVLINLVNNAVESMSERGHGTLIVRLRPTDAGACIEVQDDGPGMTQETLAVAYRPFHTTKDTGSGLGLYLVRQIVERHMGHIECETAPGAGTTFRVYLPRDGLTPEEEVNVPMVGDGGVTSITTRPKKR